MSKKKAAEEEVQDEGLDFGARTKLYEQYGQESENKETETPPEEEVTEEEELKPEAEETPSETELEPGGLEKPTEEKRKTVPLEALHEERERRKTLQGDVEGLRRELQQTQEQLHQVLQDYKALVDVQPKEDDEEHVSRGYIRTLENKVKELETELKGYGEQAKKVAVETQAEKVNTLVEKVDKELSGEGYPGFAKFRLQVALKQQELFRQGERNIPDNPEGWKVIYKQFIYPDIRQIFGEQKKVETFKEKEERKKKAGLIGSPGSSGKTGEEKKEWSYDDYKKNRAKHSAL